MIHQRIIRFLPIVSIAALTLVIGSSCSSSPSSNQKAATGSASQQPSVSPAQPAGGTSNSGSPAAGDGSLTPPAASANSAAGGVDNAGNGNNDSQEIRAFLQKAADDLTLAVNQRDFNRLDQYFDLSDPAVRTRLTREKANLRKLMGGLESIRDFKLSNMQITSLAINGNQANAKVTGKVTGTVKSEGQSAPIAESESESIKLHRTDKGWRIVDLTGSE